MEVDIPGPIMYRQPIGTVETICITAELSLSRSIFLFVICKEYFSRKEINETFLYK
jgi:hypothetical protein